MNIHCSDQAKKNGWLGDTLGEHFFELYKNRLPSNPNEWELNSMYFNGLLDKENKNEFVIHEKLGNNKHGFCIVFKKI